ncbi:hypothetical protein [Vibrio harveyi]|uniref:hypothetical protein n=1 Tax=Vibrio harveyi TaxID=669 RepID=UPI0023806232|nr:hypothetical protein [Vibrio harveyi]HDM8062537.1 hypothetical protein [Vibrio harveyi]
MEFQDFLPAIITGLFIAPFGAYLKKRMNNLATNDDFDSALRQLKKSTKAVEQVKSQLNERFWVKQQIWETKRVAYEELITCLNTSQKYLNELVIYLNEYTDCYVHISTVSHGLYETEQEEQNAKSYEAYINGEQQKFREQFESQEAVESRDRMMTDMQVSIKAFDNSFSLKSMYLSAHAEELSELLTQLKSRVFTADLSQEDDENQADFYERVLGHYQHCQQLNTDLLSLTKKYAIQDLNL